MLKVEFHAHSADDPWDFLSYTSEQLVDRAVEEGYAALALTFHGKVADRPELFEHARRRGLLLIAGIEKFIEGSEVLLLNVTPEEVTGRMDFGDLARLREKKGPDLLVIAPHPYYPTRQVLGRDLERHIGLFDAIEICYAATRFLNFNRRAVHVAQAHGKPLVATGDIHQLHRVGRNYCLVDAPEASVRALFDAVRAGRVRNHHPPLSVSEAALVASHIVRDKIRRLLAPPQTKSR